MFQKLIFFLVLFSGMLANAQQNNEFERVQRYYDSQRVMISSEFQKKFEKEPDAFNKNAIKNDFIYFMQKMDSLQNSAFIHALVSTRNREDLQHLVKEEHLIDPVELKKHETVSFEKAAEYPGGMNAMRKQVAELFYLDAVNSQEKVVKSEVAFVVERDGSINSVQAKGENSSFNMQAEIALYRLPKKFSPALFNGTPVRYHFRLPLTMSFE